MVLFVAACAESNTSDVGPVDVGFYDGGPGVDGCPPSAPFGVMEGAVLPDPALVDCDGNPVSLHGTCGKQASWQFHFAGW
jgi:hypothetical protein